MTVCKDKGFSAVTSFNCPDAFKEDTIAFQQSNGLGRKDECSFGGR